MCIFLESYGLWYWGQGKRGRPVKKITVRVCLVLILKQQKLAMFFHRTENLTWFICKCNMRAQPLSSPKSHIENIPNRKLACLFIVNLQEICEKNLKKKKKRTNIGQWSETRKTVASTQGC